MARRKIEEIVEELVLPVVGGYNYELVDVEFVKEGVNWYLRIYIDKPGGITLDDCQLVSEGISEKLDAVDPIDQSYYLEVSSPGLERPLKKDRDFERYKGQEVEVKLFSPLDGQKQYNGELLGLAGNNFSIKLQDGYVMEFERDKVATVKRAIKF